MNQLMMNLFTTIWYKEFILAGAIENGLPVDYIKELENIESIKDANDKRSKANENILIK